MLALALLCVVIFGFGLGSFGLLDPDEPFYSLTAKEMLQKHDFSTPILFGEPQFEKPIFFYWIVCLCYKIFGMTEFASRLGPLLGGVLTVLITYLWGVLLFKRRTVAFVSAVVLATAVEFMVVSRIVLTDMYVCLFVTASLFFFSLGYENEKIRKASWLSVFLFCSLGFLTKGPIGILFPWMGIIGFLWMTKEMRLLRQFPWVLGTAVFLAVGFSWYALMTVKYGTDFLNHFFIHENVRRFFFAEHKGNDKLIFYPGALFLGFLPWSVFFFSALFYGFRRAFTPKIGTFHKPLLFLVIFFLPTLIFLTLAKSKLLSYILPVFPAVALLIGVWMALAYRAVRQGAVFKFSIRFFSVFFWGLLPLGLVVGGAIYGVKNELGIFWPVLTMAVGLIPLSWSALWFFFKKDLKKAFWLAVTAFAFSYVVVMGWLMESVDGVFSSKKDAALYQILTVEHPDTFIIGSKLFVRGATYYTGNDNVGVLTGDPKRVFYTKHPIAFISTHEDLIRIDKKLFPVYGFLKTKDLRFLREILGNNFSVTTLRTSANRVFVRLDRAA